MADRLFNLLNRDNENSDISITTVYSGNDVPNINMGNHGDIYINRTNRNFYLKDDNFWNLNQHISRIINGQNIISSTGPVGNQGPAGIKGHTGIGKQGNTGLQGPMGLLGPAGTRGPDGTVGDMGRKGNTGDKGSPGHPGCTGSMGPQGLQGMRGFEGQQGIIGSQGLTGNTGSRGFKGAIGQKGETGPTGKQGTQGKIGSVGPNGDQGEIGLQGYRGMSGYVGSAGTTGNEGLQGIPGPQGIKGNTGSIGIAGSTGAQGVQGVKGEIGPKGLKGVGGGRGEKGEKSEKGEKGDEGLMGPIGSDGDRGFIGSTGLKGITGARGSTGTKGEEGDSGDKGDEGERGQKGDEGLMGPIGAMGERGVTGADGPEGRVGSRGLTGLQGTEGYQGVAGPRGEKGERGPKGLQGAPGPQGIPGPSGSRGVEGPQGNIGPIGSGTTGSQGIQGVTGLQGIIGFKGDIGSTGPQGIVGPQGIQGKRGDKGDEGLMGPMGAQGDKGNTGARGITGEIGSEGIIGPRGYRGETGLQGLQGIEGIKGDFYKINNTIYVDGKYGNDIQGEVEEVAIPFKTIEQAIKAADKLAQTNLQKDISIVVRSNTYLEEKLFDNLETLTHINIRFHDGTIVVNKSEEALFNISKTSPLVNVNITGNALFASCKSLNGVPSILIKIDQNVVFNIQALSLVTENKTMIQINDACVFNLYTYHNKADVINNLALNSLHGISMKEPLIQIDGASQVNINTNNIYAEFINDDDNNIKLKSLIKILDNNPHVNLKANNIITNGNAIEINSGTCDIDCHHINSQNNILKIINATCHLSFNMISGAKQLEDIASIYVKNGTLNIKGGDLIYGEDQNNDKLYGIMTENSTISGTLNSIEGKNGSSICGIGNNNINLKIYNNIDNLQWDNGYLNLECNNILGIYGTGIAISGDDNIVNIRCNQISGNIVNNGQNVYIIANNYQSTDATLSINGSGGYHKYMIDNINIKDIIVLNYHRGTLEINSNKIELNNNFDLDSTSSTAEYIITCNILEANKFNTSSVFNGLLFLNIKNYAILNGANVEDRSEDCGLLINSHSNVCININKLDTYNLRISPTQKDLSMVVNTVCTIENEFYLGGCKNIESNFMFKSNTVIYTGKQINRYGLDKDNKITHLNGNMEIDINNFNTLESNIVHISSNGRLVLRGNHWNTNLRLQSGNEIYMSIKELKTTAIKFNKLDPIRCVIYFDKSHIIDDLSSRIIMKDMNIISETQDENTILFFDQCVSNISLFNCILINRLEEGYNARGTLISSDGNIGKFMAYNCVSNLPADETIISDESRLKWLVEPDLYDM